MTVDQKIEREIEQAEMVAAGLWEYDPSGIIRDALTAARDEIASLRQRIDCLEGENEKLRKEIESITDTGDYSSYRIERPR